MGEKIEKTEKGDKTKKLFDYDNADLYADFMHTQIACGFYHCLAISDTERENKETRRSFVYGWGKNQFGVLGGNSSLYEEADIIAKPRLIQLQGIAESYHPLQVSCGKNHSLILASNTSIKQDKLQVGSKKEAEKEEETEMHVGEVFALGEANKLGVKNENVLHLVKSQEQNSDTALRRIEGGDGISQSIANTLVIFPYQNPKIRMISCGSTFSLALDVNGFVYSWGDGSSGALGTGSYQDELTPFRLKFDGMNKMRFINAGYFHAASLSDKGHLFTWGIGSEGQLGHKSNININFPKKVDFFESGAVAFVSCGMYHTACIDEKGFLYTYGGNKNGQLGHGDYEDRNYPAMVKFFKNYTVIYVNCGSNTSFVITDEGKTFSFGSNLNGKLAGVVLENELMQSNTFSTPLECKLLSTKITDFYEGDLKETLITGTRVYQFATSNQFCMALTNKGYLFTWGNNNNGCLGRLFDEVDDEIDEDFDHIPNKIADIIFKKTKNQQAQEFTVSSCFVDIKTGLYHSVGLTNAGEVYVWGSNQFSQHGLSANKLKEQNNKLTENLKMFLEYFSSNMLPSLVDIFDIKENKKVTMIACGFEYVFAVQNNKIVYSWGRNTHGQCGIGSVSNYVEEPHMISFFDSHVIKNVVCGENHTLVLDDKGDLYSCGCSYGGKLGLGFMTTVQTSPKLINLKGVTDIACGPNHSMALVKELKKDSKKTVLYTWGSGWNGELGHGNTDNVYNPKFLETKYNFIQISCGSHHSAGITDELKLAVWGPYKYLGVMRPEDVAIENAVFLFPQLHPMCVLNENLRFISVVLGDKYNVAICQNKELYHWGVFDITYNKIIKGAKSQGSNEEATYEKNIKNPSRLETELKFENVSVSSNHAVALCKSYPVNKLFSWGIDGNTGRLGLGYEYTDEEFDEENKKNQKQKMPVLMKYDEPMPIPNPLHFLNNYVYRQYQADMRKKQEALAKSAVEHAKGGGMLNAHKNSSGSNQKISSTKNIASSFQNFPDYGKKSGGAQDKTRGTVNSGSRLMDKSTKMNSVMDLEVQQQIRYDLFETCQDEDLNENLLNYQRTHSVFIDNQTKYTEIRNAFQNVLETLREKKILKKRIVGIILKRISSYPFEAKFISKEQKQQKLLTHPEFLKNRKKFRAIFTVLQLHPCYLFNIYKADKLGSEAYLKLVIETYGDLENDSRKISLYMTLCRMIMEHEVNRFIETGFTKGEDYESLDFKLDPNSNFYIFVRLYIHLFYSSLTNKKWVKFCVKKISDEIDTEIWETEKPSKQWKQNAIVFRDNVPLQGDVDKKKYYSDRVATLLKILGKVLPAFRDCKTNQALDVSKHIKGLSDVVRSIFKNKANEINGLGDEDIKKRLLSLVFTPLYEELTAIEMIGKAKYDDDQMHKKERILTNNFNAINDALKHFIKGKLIISAEQKETWLDELNTYIADKNSELLRSKLYENFLQNEEKVTLNTMEADQQKMLKHVFKHSVSNSREIIKVSLKNIVNLSNLIHTSIDEWKVMNPLKKEILFIIDQKIMEEKVHFIGYQFKPEDEHTFFNLKLKTKQLLKSDQEKKIKQCKICKCYLIEDFLRTEDFFLVDEFQRLNPESLEALLLQIISIKQFEKARYELLFSNKSDLTAVLEEFLNRFKTELKYEQTLAVKTFMKQFQDVLTLKKSKDSDKVVNYMKTNQNEMNQFHLMKELKKNLEEKASKANIFINKNQVLNATLEKIFSNYISQKNNDKVPGQKEKERVTLDFYKRSIKLCFYGLANREFEKLLQNNPIALSGKMGASIRATSMSNDLYENMQYLLDEREKNFSLFGCYPYKLLKSKGILESLNNDVLYKIDLPKLKEKLNVADPSGIKKLKNNFYYVFSDNKRQGLEISLCYRQIEFKFYRWLCGLNNKKQKKNFEVIIETFEIKEEELLIIRKRDRELESGKNDKKIILDIGKYSKFSLSRFLELINSLQNHYMIYDDTFVKAG